MIMFFAFFHVDQSTEARDTSASTASEKKVDDFDIAVRELKFEIKGKVRIKQALFIYEKCTYELLQEKLSFCLCEQQKC